MAKNPVKQLFRILFITASIGSLWFVPWILVKAWILPLPDTVQEQLNQSLDHGFDGIIVYVDQAGKPPEFYAAGWHDRKNKIKAYPQALFKIASITKLYVAVATAKLVKNQQLSLDKTVADYFPELKGSIENAERITLKMMLQHRSGIPNFIEHPDYWTKPPKNSQDMLDYALDLPADFEPDADYKYSNTNYLLISNLIDKVLGYSHKQYIKEEILIPLGLKNTFGSLQDVDINRVMSGYYVGYEEDFKTEDMGLMLATVEDVGMFLRALNDGSVFNEGEQEIYSAIYVYEHTGLIVGYQSIAKYHEDLDTVVIQFNNTTNFDGYDWNLAEIMYNRVLKIVRKQRSK
ncbi:serine hydrolase domain-containing protein [Mariniflexile sp. AS56]|uniref:serine hydrolase domain-containing protein n=1 Tax=Mariniflexile sp. AS56 TaxID=3063957 RepID=UPI0026E92BC5|nr:serine hydrolase domain-containing protein [Mariniflexile sp. AS56]MDO7171246.1 serine hydrolase domain-containing protein [Mariniflexile sp. AS56]